MLAYDDVLGKITISSTAGGAGGGTLPAMATMATSLFPAAARRGPSIPRPSPTLRSRMCAGDCLLGRATGTGAVHGDPCTAAGRALLDDADAAAQRVTLGLTALQPLDATLTALAGSAGPGCSNRPAWMFSTPDHRCLREHLHPRSQLG